MKEVLPTQVSPGNVGSIMFPLLCFLCPPIYNLSVLLLIGWGEGEGGGGANQNRSKIGNMTRINFQEREFGFSLFHCLGLSAAYD